MKEASVFLKSVLKENSLCVVAFSGGPDSMYLLHLLQEVQKEKKIRILCAHVNHNTRAGNEKEEKFVRDYLFTLEIPCEFYKIESYKNNKFSEEEGREKRYAFLKKVMKEHHGDYLFTAHHGDDLIETILMRILRGSTLKGYAGIERVSTWDGVTLVRPLLSLSKKEIKEYLDKNNIPYVTDETNESNHYLRNRIRHTIIPFLEEEEPKYISKFLKFSNTLLESEKLLEEKTENIIEDNKINKELFLKKSEQEQKRILKHYFKKVYKEELKSITDKHTSLALDMIRNEKERDTLTFPKKKELKKNKNSIWLQDKKESEPFFIELKDTVTLPDGSVIQKEKEYTMKSNYEIHLNSKDIKFPLYITTRKPGMKMEVKNLNGSRKLKDIFIDAHLEKEEKDEIPILIDSNNTVLWVLGMKKSKYDLEKSENYDIIYKYIKKEGKKK